MAMPYRTKTQAEANEFDADLYRLISRADFFADRKDKTAKLWAEVGRRLNGARPVVRGMMHQKDADDTK